MTESDASIQEAQTFPELSAVVHREPASIEVCRDGAWLSAGELFQRVGAASDLDGPLSLDLAGLDHLEAAPLQVLIATHLERAREGREVVLLNVSESLKRWFSLSGANFILKVS